MYYDDRDERISAQKQAELDAEIHRYVSLIVFNVNLSVHADFSNYG